MRHSKGSSSTWSFTGIGDGQIGRNSKLCGPRPEAGRPESGAIYATGLATLMGIRTEKGESPKTPSKSLLEVQTL